MAFRSIDDYHDACRAQIIADAQIGVRSLFLPNTYFSPKPKPQFCLIATEPSLSALGEAEFQTLINQGMTNFMYSRGDFILQYCAYLMDECDSIKSYSPREKDYRSTTTR